jgi:hypothetical protein
MKTITISEANARPLIDNHVFKIGDTVFTNIYGEPYFATRDQWLAMDARDAGFDGEYPEDAFSGGSQWFLMYEIVPDDNEEAEFKRIVGWKNKTKEKSFKNTIKTIMKDYHSIDFTYLESDIFLSCETALNNNDSMLYEVDSFFTKSGNPEVLNFDEEDFTIRQETNSLLP